MRAPDETVVVPALASTPATAVLVRPAGSPMAFWSVAFALTLALWSSGSASMTYPLYISQWGLTTATTSAIFAIYPIVLVVVLTLFGNISDHIGRRAALVIGLTLLLLGAVGFATAPDVAWLFVGRVLQGLGVGLVLGAGAAALVDLNPYRSAELPAVLNTISQSAGLSLATIVGGVLITYAPAPLHLSFWLLAGLIVVSIAGVLRLPRHNSVEVEAPGPWRPAGLAVPRALRQVYLVAAFALSAAFAIGAVFIALGSQIAQGVIHSRSALATGLVLSVSFLMVGATAIALRRVRPRGLLLVGGAAAIVSVTALVISSAAHSLPWFIASAVLSGAGYAGLATGGVGLAAAKAPAHHRARLLSSVFLVGYFVQGAAAFGAGVLASHAGLPVAVVALAGLITALSLVVLALARRVGRR